MEAWTLRRLGATVRTFVSTLPGRIFVLHVQRRFANDTLAVPQDTGLPWALHAGGLFATNAFARLLFVDESPRCRRSVAWATLDIRGLLVLLASPLGCLCFFCRNPGRTFESDSEEPQCSMGGQTTVAAAAVRATAI